MRGIQGQRAPPSWTPGFTVLTGILLAATRLESHHPPLPHEDGGVSGETWHGLKSFESAGNRKKQNTSKPGGDWKGLIIIPDSPRAIPLLSVTGTQQVGVHRAEKPLSQAAETHDAPSREGKARERTLEGEEEDEGTDSPAPSPSSPHIPWPWGPSHLPQTREHLGGEAPVGEGREVRGTGSNLGQASQGVDLTRPSILVFPEVDGVSRIDGGVLVKEVVGSQNEPHTVPHCHGVGNVLCMWDVQETGCHPGHQVLAGEERGPRGLALLRTPLPPTGFTLGAHHHSRGF